MADVTAARIIIPVETRGASAAAANLGKVDKAVTKTNNTLKKSNTTVNKNIQSFNKFKSALGGVVPILGVAGLVGVLRKSVQAASNLQEQTSKFLVVFRKVPVEAQKAASISKKEIIDTTARFVRRIKRNIIL